VRRRSGCRDHLKGNIAVRVKQNLSFVSRPSTLEFVGCTLEFVGCKELTDRLNLFIGLPDDALVYYVVLRGPFWMTNVSYPPGSHHGVGVSQTVQEIYDAGTGRLLVWGAGPSKSKGY
jgi:hypothetical protein